MLNHFSAGNHILRKALQLSYTEMAVLSEITRLSWNSRTGGWCIKSRKNMSEYLDISVRSIQDIMKAWFDKGYIEYPDDMVLSDSRVRCTEFIYVIRETENVSFVVSDDKGHFHLVSCDFFEKIKEINSQYSTERLNKYLALSQNEGVQNLQGGAQNLRGGVQTSHGGVRTLRGGGANFAYINTHIKDNNKSFSVDGSIAKSDTDYDLSKSTTNNMYENKKDGCGVSYACIGNSEGETKAKKERKEVESKIKAFKPLFLDLHGLYRGRKSDAEDHHKKLFNKLKTSKRIDEDLIEFEKGLKNYMNHCEKNRTEEKYIKHFKNFIHDMVWKEYQDQVDKPTQHVVNQQESITPENMERLRVRW